MHIAAKQSPPFLEGFVLNSEKKKVYTVSMVPYGFYKVQDRYFQDFPSPEDRYMHNKSETGFAVCARGFVCFAVNPSHWSMWNTL